LKLLVGLGNPDRQYALTRHNVGFVMVDLIAQANGFSGATQGFDGEYRRGKLFGEDCYILKPMTYMNLSGRSVGAFMRYFKIEPSDLIVIYDDVDLEPGKVKARTGGGHGGHNGVRNILDELGVADFHRIKVGIGKPVPGDVKNWVLGRMTQDELDHLRDVVVNEVLLRIRSIFLQTKAT
jgi:PTH1 family peptidyl-tRNA hydrolase